MEIYKKNNQK